MALVPCGTLHRSPWVRVIAFTAWAARYTLQPLDGYGLCDQKLTRPDCPASYLISAGQLAVLLHTSFRPYLTITPLCFTMPSAPSAWQEDFHLQAITHAKHTFGLLFSSRRKVATVPKAQSTR